MRTEELAVRAERAGFDYALTQVRYMASYGVNAAAQATGRAVRFGLNGFLIARDTEAEARETLR